MEVMPGHREVETFDIFRISSKMLISALLMLLVHALTVEYAILKNLYMLTRYVCENWNSHGNCPSN